MDGRPDGVHAAPLLQVRAARFNRMPVIIGTNKDEAEGVL